MKVIKLEAPSSIDALSIRDSPNPPAPKSGEIQVRLHANSLNYHDYLVASGKITTALGRVPLSDGAGVVEAVGADVVDCKEGDAVVSCFFPDWQQGPPTRMGFSMTPGDGLDGYACERITRPAHWFTRAPENFSHLESASLPTAGLTAWRALVVDGRLKAGETVLVLGTGGVSIFATQLARLIGASVIATSSSDEKLERIRRLGACHTINYRAHPDWASEVLNATGGEGVDHVIEVGGPATLPQSINACRLGGHIALIGVTTGFAGQIPTVKLMDRHLRLQGLTVGNRQQQLELVRALSANSLRPVIDRTFALSNLSDAFKYQESGKHFGKIGIEI